MQLLGALVLYRSTRVLSMSSTGRDNTGRVKGRKEDEATVTGQIEKVESSWSRMIARLSLLTA